MKNLQENNRTLDSFMMRISQELKRSIKFCRSKLSQDDLLSMSILHLKKLSCPQTPKKENMSMTPDIQDSVVVVGELEEIKKQLRLERQINRKLMNRLHSSHFEGHSEVKSGAFPITSQFSPFPKAISPNKQCPSFDSIPIISSITKDNQFSLKKTPSQASTQRTGNLLSSQTSEAKPSGLKIDRARTLSKLRKVQSMFCTANQKKTKNTLKHGLWTGRQKSSLDLIEENQNLRTIQGNLQAHLSILQKFKYVPSLESLIEKEETLRKKQVGLQELEKQLWSREISLCKNQN